MGEISVSRQKCHVNGKGKQMSDGLWNSNQKWFQFTNTSSPWALLQDSTIAFLAGLIPHI